MKMLVVLSTGALLLSTAAFAQPMAAGGSGLMTNVPSSSLTVTDWYKQDVYNRSNDEDRRSHGRAGRAKTGKFRPRSSASAASSALAKKTLP